MSERDPRSEMVGDAIRAGNAAWSFGGEVSQHFDDHLRRSVPLYELGLDLACRISDYFIGDDSLVVDLGCSTGQLLATLADRHRKRSALRLIGVDREAGMIEAARKRCSSDRRVSFEQLDLLEFRPEEGSIDLICCCYTMQFVRPAFRQELYDRIFRSLRWGGALILFEKVRAADARFQDMMTALYHDYKLEQGYAPEEVLAKSRSLKGVLEPFSTAANFAMLERAGFVDAMSVQKYICFEGILAIK